MAINVNLTSCMNEIDLRSFNIFVLWLLLPNQLPMQLVVEIVSLWVKRLTFEFERSPQFCPGQFHSPVRFYDLAL
jgi:hypothetical protein